MNNIIERTGSDVTFSEEVCKKIISLEKQAKEIKKQQDDMKQEILATEYSLLDFISALKKFVLTSPFTKLSQGVTSRTTLTPSVYLLRSRF